MLKVGYYKNGELLINGQRKDYETLQNEIMQFFGNDDMASKAINVISNGETPITQIALRKGQSPNKIFYEAGTIIFSFSLECLPSFLSFIGFPLKEELPKSPIRYHHHYESIGLDDPYIAADSLGTIFGLEEA